MASNTSTHTPIGWCSMLLTMGCVFALVCAAEIAARQCSDAFGTFGGWDNRTLYHRVMNADESVRENGHWNMLLYGSSVGLPLQPSRWMEATGNDVVMYNGCVGGQRPDMLQVLYEGVFYPMGRPDKLVYIITPTDVNAGTDARAGESVLWQAPRVRLVRKDLNFAEHCVAWLDVHSALFGARRHLRTRLERGVLPEEPEILFLPDGSRLSPFSVTTPEIAKKHNPLENFSFNPRQSDAIVSLVEFCKANGTDVRLVSQPLPECAYDDCLSTTESERARKLYETGLRDIEQRCGLQVTRLNDGQTTFADELAYDALHANRRGAEVLMAEYWSQVIGPLFANIARTQNLPVEQEFRFSDLQTSRTALVASGLPWATEGVVCADGVSSASIPLPGVYAPGKWRAEFSVQYPSQGEAVNATVSDGKQSEPVRRMSDLYARETGYAFAEITLSSSSSLCVNLGEQTRLNALFLRPKILP